MHVPAKCSPVAWQRIILSLTQTGGDSCASDGATVVSYLIIPLETSPARSLAARRIADMFLVPFSHRHLSSSHVADVAQG
jgi:hypothetical protein